MSRVKGTVSTLGLMCAALLFPFFGTSETGCRPTAAFPCEAEPVVTATSGLLTDWAAEHGPFFELSVTPFSCPDRGRVEEGRVVPIFTSFGPTLCGDHDYWERRAQNSAGPELARQLAERFQMPRPPGPEVPARQPGQVNVAVAVTCTPNPTPEALRCEIAATLVDPSPSGAAAPEPPASGPTVNSTQVSLALPRADNRPLGERPPLSDLWRQMTRASPMPLVMAEHGIDELVVAYLVLFLLTAGALLIELRWRWPRILLLLSTVTTIGALVVLLFFGDAAFSNCGPFFAAHPDLSTHAFLDHILNDVQIGFLLFVGAGVGNTVCNVRRWRRQRRPG